MQMASDITVKTHDPSLDQFIFRIQGRESLFRWDENEILTKPEEGVEACIQEREVEYCKFPIIYKSFVFYINLDFKA